MNRVKSFFEKQHGLSNDYSYDFALGRLCVSPEDSWRGITPSNYSSDYNPEPPIFAAKFANCENYKHILAIANEDGKIALQDTNFKNKDFEERALNAPQCHYNAVFDLEWAPGQMQFVSASGDHTARLWDVSGSEIRSCRVFNGHTRSVKTAAFRKRDSSVFATGGRDGAILIWDTRANLNLDLTSRADNCIYSGHSGGPGTPISQKKKNRTPKLGQTATSSSITGLVFQDSTTLISCGAGDGIIKVWDLRRNYTSYKKEPLPKYSLPYAGSSTFKGFTNLVIDEAGAKLYANCMDNSIYCYNIFSYSTKPLEVYTGFRNSTFYIKSCLSPDGKYLISGSSDEKAYIWNLNYPKPLVALFGHTVEVTCVAWGSYRDMPIVTCSDDARHKIWRIGPELFDENEKNMYKGYAKFCKKIEEEKSVKIGDALQLKDLECTPRSLKRLVQQNEKTPGTEEKINTKRPFAEMVGEDIYERGVEQKRPKILESRGRRLFSPTDSNAVCKLHTVIEEQSDSDTLKYLKRDQLKACNQENEHNSKDISESLVLPSTSTFALSTLKFSLPLSEKVLCNRNCSLLNQNVSPTTSHTSCNSVIFSPTSNLPNYVVDGDAPHLGIMSPKRKSKEKVDWLTKIRKQKLSNRSVTLSDKLNEAKGSKVDGALEATGSTISSLRLQNSKNVDESPRLYNISRRHTSHLDYTESSPSSTHGNIHSNTQRTPTSSRRNSETSILRFFSSQQKSSPQIRQCLQDNMIMQQTQNISREQTTSCTD